SAMRRAARRRTGPAATSSSRWVTTVASSWTSTTPITRSARTTRPTRARSRPRRTTCRCPSGRASAIPDRAPMDTTQPPQPVEAVIFDWGGTLSYWALVEFDQIWRMAAHHLAPHLEEDEDALAARLAKVELDAWDQMNV